jgi:tetratricopeptide (TPR) repeat protein
LVNAQEVAVANQFKFKQRERPVWTAAEQRARIHKARGEGRTQQALELARTLFKHEATPEHLDLVRTTTLERARQLRNNGNDPDAATMLTNAVDLGGAEFLKEVARELVAAGAIRQAQELAGRLDDPSLSAGMMVQAADTAIRQGAAGRNLLPETLRQQFDLIRAAFAQAETGQDDAARASLQGIGLQSPFLEWKLFVRGLLAYYQNDDARALENWNRLDSARLPFRLAGPFRFIMDPSFRQAQTPAAQMQLQKAADQLQHSALASSLRTLQGKLGHEDRLAEAFRAAENLLPALRQQAPALAARLASCFYWAIISHGHPEDKNRYLRVFGAPANDPYLNRLEALALETRGDLEAAHGAWEDFQAWLEHDPTWGTADQRRRARALVWNRMGVNADQLEDDRSPLFRPFEERPPALEADAEHCFRKSLELAPDCLDAHMRLFEHYLEEDQTKKAIKAGESLLKQFPEHVPTLETLARVFQEKGDHEDSVRLLQCAVKINPLERNLRVQLATAHMFHARSLVEKRRFDAARTEYQTALALEEPRNKPGVLCRWAAGEIKAKNQARADELLLQARQEGGRPAFVAYYMAIEGSRSRLTKEWKSRFGAEFSAVLVAPPTVADALDLVELTVSHVLTGVEYFGRKTHEKKVLAYAERALALSWTENELERFCTGLVYLKASKLLKKAIRLGKRDFPSSPVFHLKNVQMQINLGPERGNVWEIGNGLERAQQLTEALPLGERRSRLFEEIRETKRLIEPFGPGLGPRRFLEELMEQFFEDD